MVRRLDHGISAALTFLFLTGLCKGMPEQDGQVPPPKSLTDASLEELMNIQVTSASRKPQRLAATAASVYVISTEDIRRSGITILPELLRLAPGVQVARLSSGSWAISIRGFNDQYSNKLLVLIDGRSVYNEFYAGVFWDTLNISADDLERIEVIRGPGAAMWGTNAVNGVINIITKSAKATKGVVLSGVAGSQTTDGSVRYGGETGAAAYRAGAENTTVGAQPLVGLPEPSHGWANRNAEFRLDWDLSPSDSLMVTGGMYRSVLGEMVPLATAAAPSLAPSSEQTSSSGGNVTARWEHIVSDTSSIEVRFSYMRGFQNDPETSGMVHTFDYGFQDHVQVGSRHDVIWGVTVRENTLSTTPSAALRLNPLNARRDEIAVFAEDEIALVPNRLSLIVGAQFSRAATVGNSFEPTLRLLWTPRTNLSSWVAVSSADRTPSLDDQGIDYYMAPTVLEAGSPGMPPLYGVIHYVGNPAERSETMLSYEAGERVQASKKLSVDLSTFYSIYHHLNSVTLGAPALLFASGMPYLQIPLQIGNDRHGESYGAELAATYSLNSRWRLMGGYSWVRVETSPYAGDTNLDQLRTSSATPQHQWEARSYFDLTRTVQIDAAIYYTAATLQMGIPQHLRGDLRIGWKPSPKVEVSVGVQDAFEANHLEYESSRFNQLSEIPRNIYGRLTWRF